MRARNSNPNTIGSIIAAGLVFVYCDGYFGYSICLDVCAL